VRTLSDAEISELERRDAKGYTLLMNACADGDVETVRRLVAHCRREDLQAMPRPPTALTPPTAPTALHARVWNSRKINPTSLACEHQHLKILKLLVDKDPWLLDSAYDYLRTRCPEVTPESNGENPYHIPTDADRLLRACSLSVEKNISLEQKAYYEMMIFVLLKKDKGKMRDVDKLTTADLENAGQHILLAHQPLPAVFTELCPLAVVEECYQRVPNMRPEPLAVAEQRMAAQAPMDDAVDALAAAQRSETAAADRRTAEAAEQQAAAEKAAADRRAAEAAEQQAAAEKAAADRRTAEAAEQQAAAEKAAADRRIAEAVEQQASLDDHPVNQFLAARRDHWKNNLEGKGPSKRGVLKDKLVGYILDELTDKTKDGLLSGGEWRLDGFVKNAAEVNDVLENYQIDIGKLWIDLTGPNTKLRTLLEGKKTFSLDEALNFHRNAFDKGETKSYGIFHSNTPAPVGNRDLMIKFLQDARTRILNKKITPKMRAATQLKLGELNECINQLKTKDRDISINQIFSLQINLENTLLDVLQKDRNGIRKTNVKTFRDLKKAFPEVDFGGFSTKKSSRR